MMLIKWNGRYWRMVGGTMEDPQVEPIAWSQAMGMLNDGASFKNMDVLPLDEALGNYLGDAMGDDLPPGWTDPFSGSSKPSAPAMAAASTGSGPGALDWLKTIGAAIPGAITAISGAVRGSDPAPVKTPSAPASTGGISGAIASVKPYAIPLAAAGIAIALLAKKRRRGKR